MLRVAAIALLAGCSSILGIEDLGGPAGTPDGGGTNDTPVPPGQVRISGSTFVLQKLDIPPGQFPNARLELVTGGESVMTTSNGMGTYSIDVDTGGGTVDAFVRVLPIPGSPEAETVNHLPPIADDLAIDLVTFANEYMLEVSSLSGQQQDPGSGFLEIHAVDEDGRPQSEVQFQLTFTNFVVYADDTGRPGPAVFNRTTSSGLAWVLNVPPGSHSIQANRNGQPFGVRDFGSTTMNGQVSNTNLTFLVSPGIMP